jgi:hypothetical protein
MCTYILNTVLTKIDETDNIHEAMRLNRFTRQFVFYMGWICCASMVLNFWDAVPSCAWSYKTKSNVRAPNIFFLLNMHVGTSNGD